MVIKTKCGMTIDADAIANGLVDIVFSGELPDSESYIAALGLGMLPNPLMEIVEDALGKKFDAVAAAQIGAPLPVFTAIGVTWTADAAKRKEFIREGMRAVALSMLRIASPRVCLGQLGE